METQAIEDLGECGRDTGTPDVVSQQSPSQMVLERLKEWRKYQARQHQELQQQLQSRFSVDFTFPSHKQIKKITSNSPEIEEESLYPYKSCEKAENMLLPESNVLGDLPPKPSTLEIRRETCDEKEGYESQYTNYSSLEASHSTPSEKLVKQASFGHPSDVGNEHRQPFDVKAPDELGDGDPTVQSVGSNAELQVCTPPQGTHYSTSESEQIPSEILARGQGYKSELASQTDILSRRVESGFSHFTLSGREFSKNTAVVNVPEIKHKFLRKGQGTARFGMKPVRLKKPEAIAEVQTEKFETPVKRGMKNSPESPCVITPDVLSKKNVKFIPKMPVKGLEIIKAPSKSTGHGIDGNDCQTKSHESRQSSKSTRPSVLNTDVDKQSLKDQEELLAFEKLEELADHSSFASDSSTVMQLLKHGHESVASTPVRSPAPFSCQGTPIYTNEHQVLENSGESRVNTVSLALCGQEGFPQSKHIHFSTEVMSREYDISETDDDDTLTDTSSIKNEDSVLFTTSDFEELALLHMHKSSQVLPQVAALKDAGEEAESYDSSSGTLTPEVPRNGLQPLTLQFSPPPYRSENTASDYIESIFGKGKGTKPKPRNKVVPDRPVKNLEHQGDEKAESVVVSPPKLEDKDEIETYKTLLLAKISELERETKIFKRENSKLQNLLQATEVEKQQLANDRQKLQEETAKERKRFEDYVDRERNSIWKERQQLKHIQNPTVSEATEHSLEIVYLKEQLNDLREESKKKESLVQFNVRKLNEKIRALEEENKQLKNANSSLQNLEKTNLQLRHELDRVKLSRKSAIATQPGNTKRKPRPTVRTTTVDSLNKSLDRMKKTGKGMLDSAGANSLNKNHLTDVDLNPGSHNTNVTSVLHPKEKFLVNEEPKFPPHSVEGKAIPEDSSEAVPFGQDIRTDTHRGDPITRRNAQGLPSEDINMESYEVVKEDGTREVTYANGNKKEIYPDGVVIVSYFNNDRKEIYEDRTVYIYGTDKTSHTTFNDGKEVYIFPSGQKETRYLDGSSEIVFADNSQRITLKDGTEVCKTKDGTVVRTNPDGSKVFEFTSGQKEVHLEGEKRREYPDGTVKILYQDGKTETRYKSGRIRMKDAEGNIILDTHEGIS